jgi:ATP-binding cassette subfamily F protein uup
MPLLNLTDLHYRLGGVSLLNGVSCRVEPGERIGLLGRNGAGKSTFLKLLSCQLEPDGGELTYAPTARVAMLSQEVPRDWSGTVTSIVRAGAPADLHEQEWETEQAVEQILKLMELDGAADFGSLSSGMKRRVLLARSLLIKPDLLLLDEPTNHLDLEAIRWLETFLGRWSGALIFVTHDRQFLRKLATRIMEIDRGKLFDWACDYDTFLQRKEAALEAEEKQNALFDKRLAEEEVWIRQGIKARRTRNEGRVRALEEMRRTRQARRERMGQVKLEIQEAERSGALIANLQNISFSYDGLPIVSDFSITVMRGDKIGIIGRNGAGKTTLLKLLLGQLQPQSGKVRLGTNQQIAYFDQLRETLDEDKAVWENIAEGSNRVTIGGSNRHVLGYLQDFLFTPEQARTPVRKLSGGERNRVLLARLFAKPANILVLDEPTNDLDMETLDLLEERLVEYPGTVLTVSHDREFLNRVVTSTIVFEEDGIREYVGGYDDWIRQRAAARSPAATKPAPASASKAIPGSGSGKPAGRTRKLTFSEQHELKGLPAQIDRLEQAIAAQQERMAAPGFYQQPREQLVAAQQELQTLETQLTQAYARWEELEALAQA